LSGTDENKSKKRTKQLRSDGRRRRWKRGTNVKPNRYSSILSAEFPKVEKGSFLIPRSSNLDK